VYSSFNWQNKSATLAMNISIFLISELMILEIN